MPHLSSAYYTTHSSLSLFPVRHTAETPGISLAMCLDFWLLLKRCCLPKLGLAVLVIIVGLASAGTAHKPIYCDLVCKSLYSLISRLITSPASLNTVQTRAKSRFSNSQYATLGRTVRPYLWTLFPTNIQQGAMKCKTDVLQFTLQQDERKMQQRMLGGRRSVHQELIQRPNWTLWTDYTC